MHVSVVALKTTYPDALIPVLRNAHPLHPGPFLLSSLSWNTQGHQSFNVAVICAHVEGTTVCVYVCLHVYQVVLVCLC